MKPNRPTALSRGVGFLRRKPYGCNFALHRSRISLIIPLSWKRAIIAGPYFSRNTQLMFLVSPNKSPQSQTDLSILSAARSSTSSRFFFYFSSASHFVRKARRASERSISCACCGGCRDDGGGCRDDGGGFRDDGGGGIVTEAGGEVLLLPLAGVF